MKKTIPALLLALLLLCGCVKAAKPSGATIEINPMAEAAAKDMASVTLYFGNSEEDALIGEQREIEAPVNERIEVSILGELIDGPSSSKGEFKALIDPATTVVDVSDNGDSLLVTLSEKFLLPTETEAVAAETRNARMRLAVYSVVNTLIEYSGFSRVQILIDREGDISGRRISLADAGFEGEGTLEPLGRNGDVIMTPRNTVTEILTAIERKDYAKLYSYIAYNDLYGDVRPSESDFNAEALAQSLMLESFSVMDDATTHTGNKTAVFIDFTLKRGSGIAESKTNIPVLMILENDVWKLRYSTLKNLFYGDR